MTNYLVVGDDGFIISMFSGLKPEADRVVALAEGLPATNQIKLDLAKLQNPLTYVEVLVDILAPDQTFPIDDERYFDGEPLPRPTIEGPDTVEIVADGLDTFSLSIPDPCMVTVDGDLHVVTGGVLEIQSDMAAEYEVIIDQWPYRLKTIGVVAHAPV